MKADHWTAEFSTRVLSLRKPHRDKRHIGCFDTDWDTQARAKSSGLLLKDAESERTGGTMP
jgi:hypothetical protein